MPLDADRTHCSTCSPSPSPICRPTSAINCWGDASKRRVMRSSVGQHTERSRSACGVERVPVVPHRWRAGDAFGARPFGMWPPEGGVSPEAVTLAASAGVRWLASDEGVLWKSLGVREGRRDALGRPWRLDTPAGPVLLLFRDRELSDR